jgi:signal transduction histidine kinase
MRLGPRRRVYLTLVVSGLVGVLASRLFNTGHQLLGCSSAPSRVLGLCANAQGFRPAVRAGVIVLLVVVAAALVALLARWALYPVRTLTATVSRLGPQNLGERVPVHREVDETTALAGQLNRMMDRLAAGYEGQRSFAANASHELRTPLAVQRTLIEVGMAEPMTPDQVQLLTRQLLETNERNERLIEGLLVLSESERGLVGGSPQRLDEIAASVVARHADLATEAKVTLATDLEPRAVFGEAVLLERLVANLVQNAIKYNREDGLVTVTVGAAPALTVTNSGTPVPAEDVPSLFEPFRRLSGTRTDHSGGAGLGLTIVRSIARAHAGGVAAVPGPDGGLSVAVTLPGAG